MVPRSRKILNYFPLSTNKSVLLKVKNFHKCDQNFDFWPGFRFCYSVWCLNVTIFEKFSKIDCTVHNSNFLEDRCLTKFPIFLQFFIKISIFHQDIYFCVKFRFLTIYQNLEFLVNITIFGYSSKIFKTAKKSKTYCRRYISFDK